MNSIGIRRRELLISICFRQAQYPQNTPRYAQKAAGRTCGSRRSAGSLPRRSAPAGIFVTLTVLGRLLQDCLRTDQRMGGRAEKDLLGIIFVVACGRACRTNCPREKNPRGPARGRVPSYQQYFMTSQLRNRKTARYIPGSGLEPPRAFRRRGF